MIFFSENKIKIKSIFCSEDKSFVLTNAGFVYSFGDNYHHCLGHELITRNENVFIPKLIDSLNNIKTIGLSQDYTNGNYYYSNTYFLTNDGFLYFCGKINENFYEKKPKLMEMELKFKDLYSKERKTIVRKENSNEIFELKSNSIIKSAFNNIFDFYANITDSKGENIGITFNTILLNTSQLRQTKPIFNFTDIYSKFRSPEASKNSIFQDLNSTGIEVIRKSSEDNNKVSRIEETKSKNFMFLMTETEPQMARKIISQELNTNIANTDHIKTFEANNKSQDTNLENMYWGLLPDNKYKT